MIRRGKRDSKWFLKHLTLGYITGVETRHPEDFWWGNDNLWDWTVTKINWRWSAIYLSYWLMSFVQLMLIPIVMHTIFYTFRPDIIGFFDFLYPNRLSGYFFYFVLLGATFVAGIGTIEDYKTFKKLRAG